MSTRSEIGMEMEDGTVRAVYCHLDGYPSNNGELLKNYTRGMMTEVLSKGNMSSLGETVKDCDFYGGEDERNDVFGNADEFLSDSESMIEWRYLLGLDGTWRVTAIGGDSKRALPLSEVLADKTPDDSAKFWKPKKTEEIGSSKEKTR